MKKLYGNGIGVDFSIWFSKPKIYCINDEGTFVPVNDKKSNLWRGGFWIESFGIGTSADCVTILSSNFDEVLAFTEAAKHYCKNYNHIQTSHALLVIKKVMKVELPRIKKANLRKSAEKKLTKEELKSLY